MSYLLPHSLSGEPTIDISIINSPSSIFLVLLILELDYQTFSHNLGILKVSFMNSLYICISSLFFLFLCVHASLSFAEKSLFTGTKIYDTLKFESKS